MLLIELFFGKDYNLHISEFWDDEEMQHISSWVQPAHWTEDYTLFRKLFFFTITHSISSVWCKKSTHPFFPANSAA
jgi:hypothetical protein